MSPVAPGPYPFDIVVQIGTFQPWLPVHQAALAAALQLAPRVALVLAQADSAPSARHPLSLDQRLELLRRALPTEWLPRLSCHSLQETRPLERGWQALLSALTSPATGTAGAGRLGVMPAPGLPPQAWPGATLLPYPDEHDDSALWRRGALEAAKPASPGPADDLPAPARHWLQEWLAGPERIRLHEEWQVLEQDRKAWSVAPWPVTKVTVDCVVECAGQVLLIRRGHAPGRDLFALPGGFLDLDETLLQAARRELEEETGLVLSHLAPRASAVFDAPWRSQRGRVITHAYHFVLDRPAPPPPRAGDDAAQAFWLPRHELPALRRQLHDDHALILEHFQVAPATVPLQSIPLL